MPESAAALLEQIAAQVRACTACGLCEGRSNAVPGEGSASSLVAFVGEGPGGDEDQQGRPFVGRSGQLLRRTIRESGWQEEDVFICNVVKCRPPNNRDPLPEEISACSHYLHAQLAIVRPKLIVTLGRFSLNLLVGSQLKITEVMGRPINKGGLTFVPTLHPAAVLRNQNLLPDFQKHIRGALNLALKMHSAEQGAQP
ncbi:uracil-DNA glycosylase [bacterium]|nr:uracil-DNA glycosylase [bacterium]